jgi:hypothetical protein
MAAGRHGTVEKGNNDEVRQTDPQAFRHPGKAFRYGIRKVRQALFWNRYYETVRDPKAKARVDMDPTIQADVVRELKANGFEVADFQIDLPDLQNYLARARYDRYPDYCGTDVGRLPEKTVEHYLAAKLLKLSPEDVYIDVATSDSPTPEMYRELQRCTVYRQDITYPSDVHGNKIGGDAADMPVPDGFATRRSLHCSFEHFEGNSDMRFIRGTGRVLRPGGKLCIVPYCLRNHCVVQTDPCVYPKGSVQFEDDALLCCTKDWGHGTVATMTCHISRPASYRTSMACISPSTSSATRRPSARPAIHKNGLGRGVRDSSRPPGDRARVRYYSHRSQPPDL